MELKDNLLEFISTELVADDVELAEHDSLLADGLVDSVGLMRLVAHIEADLHCQIPLEDIILENFRNVAAIVSYLERSGVAPANAGG